MFGWIQAVAHYVHKHGFVRRHVQHVKCTVRVPLEAAAALSAVNGRSTPLSVLTGKRMFRSQASISLPCSMADATHQFVSAVSVSAGSPDADSLFEAVDVYPAR